MSFGANTVANFILGKFHEEAKPVTPLGLMKLVYISHGVYLSLTDKPLISERVEAWKYGPVIPDLYNDIKKYGSNPIPNFLEDDGDPQALSENENAVKALTDTYNYFKDWTAFQLSDLTHKADSPWDIVYNELGGKFQNNTRIPNALIKEYFSKVYTGSANAV